MVTEEEINEIKNTWQIIFNLMRQKNVSPEKLAKMTDYPLQIIENGTKGEPEIIELKFLRNCVRVLVFGKVSGRSKVFENTMKMIDNFTYEDCVRLLKPSPAMPPRQGNPWEWDDEEQE